MQHIEQSKEEIISWESVSKSEVSIGYEACGDLHLNP